MNRFDCSWIPGIKIQLWKHKTEVELNRKISTWAIPFGGLSSLAFNLSLFGTKKLITHTTSLLYLLLEVLWNTSPVQHGHRTHRFVSQLNCIKLKWNIPRFLAQRFRWIHKLLYTRAQLSDKDQRQKSSIKWPKKVRAQLFCLQFKPIPYLLFFKQPPSKYKTIYAFLWCTKSTLRFWMPPLPMRTFSVFKDFSCFNRKEQHLKNKHRTTTWQQQKNSEKAFQLF